MGGSAHGHKVGRLPDAGGGNPLPNTANSTAHIELVAPLMARMWHDSSVARCTIARHSVLTSAFEVELMGRFSNANGDTREVGALQVTLSHEV